MPMARAFCASIAIGVSTSPCTVIIRSAISSMITTMYGRMSPRYTLSSNATSLRRGVLSGCSFLHALVEVLEVAAAVGREQLVPLLHLHHRPLQHRRRITVVGDHLVPQVRQRVVHRQLDHLRVHHQEAQRLAACAGRRGS